METKKIVIIGAGPTALGAIHRLYQLRDTGYIQENGFEVQILEQECEAGGLARSITDSNGFTWDLGIHVTGTSKYPEFVRVLNETIPNWNSVKRCVKADMSHILNYDDITTEYPHQQCSLKTTHNSRGDLYVPYPVQSSIPYFNKKLREQCMKELNEAMESLSINQTFNDDLNFGEFSKRIFGETLQRAFIRPYNEKVWTLGLEEMSIKWVEGRVPRIDYELLRRRCAQSNNSRSKLQAEDAQKPQIYFKYPTDCKGIGEIWRRLAKKFNANIFNYQQKVIGIDKDKKQVTTKCQNDQSIKRAYHYDILISTIAITELGKLLNLKKPILLKHSKVILVGIGLKLPQNELAKELSWAYYPQPERVFYRCTILSNFSTNLTPNPTQYWSVLCEIGCKPDQQIDDKEIIEKTIQDLIDVGIVNTKDQVYSSWLQILPYGYPIPTLNRDQILFETHKTLHDLDIYSRGRFGGWRYEISNQDHSFECGIQLIDRLFLNIKETLYEC